MKIYTLLILMLVSVGAALAVPVKITADGEAYGHHGMCDGWNSCGNPEQCALAACKVNGFNTLVSYGNYGPCSGFANCNLFNSISGDVPSVQCEWGNGCGVYGVTDIWCDDGNWTGTCEAVLPDQSNPPGNGGSSGGSEVDPEVPEFGVVAATIAIVGALAVFAYTKKD